LRKTKITILLVLVLTLTTIIIGCGSKKPSINVYNWGDYIDKNVIKDFQNEFGRANPVMAETLEDLSDAMLAKDEVRANRIFDAMPNISIDYALMEKSGRVNVIPGNFLWDDLGAWDSLYRTFPQDNSGNVSYGEPVLIDCKNSIVYNAPGQKQMAVAAVGLQNIIVVVQDDAVLIMPADQAQDVRKAVIALRDRGAGQL